MGALQLTLLGGFRRHSARGHLGLPTKKAQALLAYLSVQPGQACTREKLAGLLWGDLDDDHARSNLRQTFLRSVSPCPAQRLRASSARLRPSCSAPRQ